MTTFSLCITFGSSGNLRTRDFKFDSMPTNAELAEVLKEFFAPHGLKPHEPHKPVRQPCALLSPRKPNVQSHGDH